MSQARNTIFALLMGVEEDLTGAVVAAVGDGLSPLTQAESQKAVERRERDLGSSAGQPAWQDLLYYLDLGQKIEVTNRLADQVRTKFALDDRSVKRMTVSLTPLIAVRNRVCHGRP